MNPEQLLERFSTHLRQVIAKSLAFATALSHSQVTPVHILAILIDEPGAIGSEVLKKINLDKNFLYDLIQNHPELKKNSSAVQTAVVPELNLASKKILERAMLIAYERAHTHVGTEHLLLAMINSSDNDLRQIIAKFKLDIADITQQLENILDSTSKFPNLDDVTDIMSHLEDLAGQNLDSPLLPPPAANNKNQVPKNFKKNNSAVYVFTNNLTDPETQKNIDPVIGRGKEIERVINILSRRTKNNPVLVGEPGVGKTAIVEGLAKKIMAGDVPDILKRKKILALDLTLLLAGTIYRGEFEARLKQIIDEVSNLPDCILFIDELHNIIGAGSSAGAMDAANILKPALARGTLRCIGATTIDEYKKHLASDPALERRFQAVDVEEPNKADTLKILQGIKQYYENFHGVIISPEALQAAVDLSVKYIHDNFLPDKAIDLIDEAAASVRVKQKAGPLTIKKQQLQSELEMALNQKELTIGKEKLDEALVWKNKAIQLEKKLALLEKQVARGKKPIRKKVSKEDIAKVLETKLNIPAKILLASEWEELGTLPDKLSQYITGQEAVIENLTKTLRQAHLGLKDKKKPLASFLFAGPSGVGKTELAKTLARELYHDEKALLRLDMSEFSEGHSTSKLLGSPAGYIGHKERNRFLEDLKKRPYCVVLLDEFDKAHADVAKLLLQILDEGELTDSTGKKIHFNHAVIVLTTNLGSELFKSSGIGFGESPKHLSTLAPKHSDALEKKIISKLKEEFGAALINRLDAVEIFNPLTPADLEKIIANNILELNEKLIAGNNLSIKTGNKILTELAKKVFNTDEGARPVQKTLQDIVQELVIEVLKNNKHKQSYELVNRSGEYKLI